MFKSATPAASVFRPTAPQCDDKCWSIEQLVIVAALLGLAAAIALLADLPLARHFQDQSLPGELRRLIRLAESFGYGGSVALIIAIAATLDHRGWRVAARLAAGAYSAGLMANSVKLLVARARPSAANLDASSLDT